MLRIILLLTFLFCLTGSRDLHSATISNPQAQVRGQVRLKQEETSSTKEPGLPWTRQEDDDSLREIARLKQVLEDVETENSRLRVGSRVFLPRSSTPSESLVAQTRLHFLNLLDLYLPDPSTANPECQRDLKAIYGAMVNLGTGTLWPLKLVDSWGKFSDGVLIGNVKELGFFRECLDIRVKELRTTSSPPSGLSVNLQQPHNSLPSLNNHRYDLHGTSEHMHPLLMTKENLQTNRIHTDPADSLDAQTRSSRYEADFEGQYCLLSYTENSSQPESGELGLRMPGLSVYLPTMASLMAYGTCIPSTCTEEELRRTVDEALVEHGLMVANVDCQKKSQHHTLSSPEIIGIVLLGVLCLVLAAATLCDLALSYARWQHLRHGPLKFLLTFSLTQNLTKLFHLDTSKSTQSITSIHGIRFLTITWVIWGHQYAFSWYYACVENLFELPKKTEPVLFQIIGNGDLSVDTFFLLSGLLVTLSLLTYLTKTGRFSPLLYYLHRLIRLIPPIALTVALVATVSGLLVSGPLSGAYEGFLKQCRHNWWMDIILLTNVILPYFSQMGPAYVGDTCLSITWYVDVDFQLFIFMPLVLLPLYYWPAKGRVWLAVVTVASLATPAIIIGVYHTWPASLLILDGNASLEHNYKVYLMPWCRAGPYLVGAWYGYLIHLARSDPSITKLRMWQVWGGWGVSTGVALAVLLGIARYNHVGTPDTVPQMSLVETVFYGGLHRAAWAVAVGWVILACHWGHGGPVDWLLSHPLWQPFSRLTYAMYLTSFPVQRLTLLSIIRPTYYTHYLKIQETGGILFLVFFVALFVSLTSEAPVLRLEKLLLWPPASSPGGPPAQATQEDQSQITGPAEVKSDQNRSEADEEDEAKASPNESNIGDQQLN